MVQTALIWPDLYVYNNKQLTNGLTYSRNKRTPVSCENVQRTVTAQGLLKCQGPELLTSFFQNQFLVLIHIFLVLFQRGLIFSLVLHNFKFYSTFSVLTALHLFLQFPGPIHLDPGDAIPPVACVSTVSSILGIISDVSNNYST